jgi:hypothetical protein
VVDDLMHMDEEGMNERALEGGRRWQRRLGHGGRGVERGIRQAFWLRNFDFVFLRDAVRAA